MENYKDDIRATRKGCFGGSDGRMLAQIASLGVVPKSAFKRMAVAKGLIEQEEIPRNAAIAAGDKIEMVIFEHLKEKDGRYESNPLLISSKYSTKNVKLIAHPDYLLKDDEKKTLFLYEVKTTKYGIQKTRDTYENQLFIEYSLGRELAESYGSDWKVRIFLVHYSTEGIELEAGFEFEPDRLTVKEVRFQSPLFDIKAAMNTASDFLEEFNEYYEGEEIDANYLPEKVKKQFDDITNILSEIKKREEKVDEFKKRLYAFMVDKDIKSIKNEYFTITRVDPTESKQIDGKKYLADLTKKHPRVAKTVKEQYTKVVRRSGYATINIKKDE